MSMSDQVLEVGGTYSIGVTFYDTDGSTAYDMTGKVGYLYLRLKGSAEGDGPDITRLTSNAAQFTWTVQASGTGTWLFKSNESLTTGSYDATVWIKDASSPTVDRKVSGDKVANYTIKTPDTGALA